MKFRVTGSNRDTGARMILELDANNRAAADRKARQAGMDVQHVEQLSDEIELSHPAGMRRGEVIGGADWGKWIAILSIVLILMGLVAYFWYKARAVMAQ